MPETPPASTPWEPPDFEPVPWLAGPDRMTIAATFWPRRRLPVARASRPRSFGPTPPHAPEFSSPPLLPLAEDRLIEIVPGTRILARCHWQIERRERPALVLVHGLEGSSESGYMLGTAERAWEAGFSVVRMNMRNCGGTEHLTPTLYNSSLSGDVRAVVEQVIEREGAPEIFVAGFSLGGNLAMKMAAEMGAEAPEQLKAVAVVSPSLDLAACADSLGRPRNWIYQRYFVQQLKRRLLRKAKLFPEIYRPQETRAVRTIREFDERITAPHSGFRGADDYYFRASALRSLARLRRPALVLAARDDSLVPFASLDRPEVRDHPCVRLLATDHGGHCGFISRHRGNARFWAERVIVDFCRCHSDLAKTMLEPLAQLRLSSPSSPENQSAVIPKHAQPDFRASIPGPRGNRAQWRGLRNLGAGTADVDLTEFAPQISWAG